MHFCFSVHDKNVDFSDVSVIMIFFIQVAFCELYLFIWKFWSCWTFSKIFFLKSLLIQPNAATRSTERLFKLIQKYLELDLLKDPGILSSQRVRPIPRTSHFFKKQKKNKLILHGALARLKKAWKLSRGSCLITTTFCAT